MNSAQMKQITDTYFLILQQVVFANDAGAAEAHLAEAFELGRTLVGMSVPPDEVPHIYHDAMVRLSQAHPSLHLAQVVERLSRPLMEALMAYGLGFREQKELHYQNKVLSRLEKFRNKEVRSPRTGDIVNDFNNLLGSMIGFAEMAGDELPEDSLARQNLNWIMANVSNLLYSEQAMRDEIILNERRFRSLVDNSPDIIARYDRECRHTFVNPAYLRETGMTLAQVLNKSLVDIGMWLPRMPCVDYCKRLHEVMDSGTPALILLEWTHPDGRWVGHEMYVVAEHDVVGKPIGALAIGRDVTLRMDAERKLRHQASYDVLTGLPNRHLFGNRLREEVAKAQREGHGLAMMFIDLDRFKEVNDTLGHGVGDQLLIEAAQRIRRCIREYDMAGRLAGDEFAVFVPEDEQFSHSNRVARSLIDAMTAPFYLGEYCVNISASIGVAIYPHDADNADTLIGCADQAMYAAKTAGRNSYCFFTYKMLEQALHRSHLANELRNALGNGQLEVHYQPIIEVSTGRAIKAEALLRWRHPVLGMVPPDQFISIAEETDLIQEIGAWVFGVAASMAKRWNTLSGKLGKRQISINMSPRQITNGCGDQIVIDYLATHDIDPAQVAIEITEGLLLDDSSSITEKLERLQLAGVQISLDDFGTGYSAMCYLKKFSIEYLKIDRSFICDLQTDSRDRAIAEAVAMMAHRLGMKVIAEGVETQAQYDLLAEMRCEFVQGYLFAKPMPAEQFLEFVNSGVRKLPGAEGSPWQYRGIATGEKRTRTLNEQDAVALGNLSTQAVSNMPQLEM